ncbi:trichohyalin-like isoform X2 [Anarrhichthys ocellatus]|uniref:trichohyalin-like isoform X2 n=1 Tax=Anarrhichthys ocellatus TaxID=433405 RepID=UPI0012EE29D4|nr:trichohyalin-like isoform X2 [Anarrhichthys ocellatus]
MLHLCMKFPVDLLADVSQTELEWLAHNYMNNLLYSNPDSPEHLALSDSTQVTIDVSSVGFVPLYGSGDKQKILALFSPSDPFTAVALYLLDRWWAVDDILKTADPARGGAVEVETVGERIVLYILNRVVYRAKEMSPEELPFLCHGEKDSAKILWNNGEAVGFYSVKPSGSFISSFSTRSYQLPVMDSIFVRKCQRGKGFGLQMLEDFVLSFKEDCLGLKYPITKFMFKVCGKYLCQYPGDTDLLWEVESIGGPNQRTNIAGKIQAMDQSVSMSRSFTEESLVITERTEPDAVMKAITTQIKEAGSIECTVEIVEEVTLLSTTREAEVPLTARSRSSGSKRRKMGEEIGEDKSEKVIRIEDIEAETPSKDQVSAQQKTELHVSELVKTEGMSTVAPGEQGEHMLDQPATVLAQQDLQDDDVTLAPSTEEPQVEDNAPQNLNSISCDSQITVENVASEIKEECQKEDTAALVVCEEALEEAETLDKVGEGTQVGVTDEKSEERVTQQELSLSTHATSENGEAGKTRRANVKAATNVESITPRRRSTRHSKQEEGVKQGTTAQKAGVILRGRTIKNTPPPTHKYTRCNQNVSEELEKEVDEVAEEEDVSTTQVVEESDGTEGEAQEEEQTSIKEDVVTVEELSEEKQQLEDEQLKNEEKMEKQQEPVDEQEAENGEEEPAVTTRTLRHGRVSTTDTPKGKSKRSRKQIQEETQKGEEESKCVEETGVGEEDVEKTDEEIEEIVDKVKEAASENEEGLDLEIDDVEEGEAVVEQKQDAVEDKTGLVSELLTEGDEGKAPEEDKMEVENEELVTVEGEKGESEEGTMMLTGEEENTAVVSAAADDLVQEETDAPLPSPATDSAVLPPVEDEATPSAEEQQSKGTATQLSDLRRVTVVLVDLQKPHHDVQDETAATEEGLPVQKTAAEAEEEQREETMKEEETVAQETVPGSSVGVEKTELEKVTVKEERCEYKVEAVTKQETEDGRDEETAEAVEATPRTRGRPRKEAAPKIKEVVPIVEIRVLRAGRKSYYARQRTKRTHKQLQEEEEEEERGEDSTAVEARETEEEEEEQQMTDLKKGEKLEERDATEQAENIEAEMASEKEDIVAEQAVNQHDAQEEGQIDCTETVADVDTEASVGQHDDEEKTLVVADEALAKQDTVEGEQSTSTSEVAESAQETMLTAKVEQAKDVSEEEVPVVERVLRSGEKTVRATKKQDDEQEEEAPGENSTEEDEPAVEIRVLRKGRKPADATPSRKSKRACTQCQTEEEREEEDTPAEEIEGEEEEAGQESPEEKDKDVEEEGARNAAGEEPTVGDAEQTKDASTEEAGELEEEVNSVEAVDGIGTDTVLPSSAEEEETAVVEQPNAAAEVRLDAATAEGEALVEDASVVAEDEAPAVTTRAFWSKQKASPSTPSPRSRRQKDDSPRRSVRKRPKVCYRENNEGERDDTDGNTDEEVKVTVASDEDQGNEKAEPSSDTDEEVEAAGSSQEDEEYEQNTSEEEEEPIVIGKRVLRGRSVPSVIITPQSKSRRRSAKVSNEERSPRSAQKRKITEVTRKSKHLSRV